MVDTLVSGASASRHVGSSPILGTKKRAVEKLLFFLCLAAPILTFPPNLPLIKGGYKSFETSLICKYLHSETALFLCPLGNLYSVQRAEPIERAGRVSVNSRFAPRTTMVCSCSEWLAATTASEESVLTNAVISTPSGRVCSTATR